jgi:hypothetical protein
MPRPAFPGERFLLAALRRPKHSVAPRYGTLRCLKVLGALAMAVAMFWEILRALILGFILSALVQAVRATL